MSIVDDLKKYIEDQNAVYLDECNQILDAVSRHFWPIIFEGDQDPGMIGQRIGAVVGAAGYISTMAVATLVAMSDRGLIPQDRTALIASFDHGINAAFEFVSQYPVPRTPR